MSLSISNEAKNALNITNDSKGTDKTLAEETHTLAEADRSTLGVLRMIIVNDEKNNLDITNESKT